jgi:hypothetical protein
MDIPCFALSGTQNSDQSLVECGSSLGLGYCR